MEVEGSKEVVNGNGHGTWWNGSGNHAGGKDGSVSQGPRKPRPPAVREPGPLGATPPKATALFVDTHCHLEEVLQMVQRHRNVSTLNKDLDTFTAEEVAHWKVLGWLKDPSDDSKRKDPETGENGKPETTPDSQSPAWTRSWDELQPAEREAAVTLGYAPEAWNRNKWLLPKNVSWSNLDEEVRKCLEILGESSRTWDTWSTQTSSSNSSGTRVGTMVVNCNDLRTWNWLSPEERTSAKALGFAEATWNSQEMADIHSAIGEIFGESFQGCVTQGCDADSIDSAREMALAHPKVYVSFGCHPKAAWAYDNALEERLLASMKACGPKAVAWGEFGLDYSHIFFGRIAGNRRVQKVVFARQLRLAIGHGWPLVIHSRAADRDTLRMMRSFVPRHWKVHVHSFRGTVSFMEALLDEWDYAYIGLAGIVTMPDPEAQELARLCPLSRLVLETDAPYLPVQSTYFSHPGQIPEIVQKVADLKGLPVEDVAVAVRENARAIYGI